MSRKRSISTEVPVTATVNPLDASRDHNGRLRWWVYLCANKAGDVIYVGRTGLRTLRMRQHACLDSWWSEVDAVEHRLCRSQEHMEMTERNLICLYKPIYNRKIPLCQSCYWACERRLA